MASKMANHLHNKSPNVFISVSFFHVRRQDVRSWQDRHVAPPVPPKPPVEVDTPVVPPSGNGLMPNLGGPGLGGWGKSTELDVDMKFEFLISGKKSRVEILSFYVKLKG